MMETFKGPLGSHKNYITHIALENQLDYLKIKKRHQEKGRSSIADKYKEFRLFLNAVESFNNIIDYLYFEQKDKIQKRNVIAFRKALHKRFPQLGELAQLANAYKHCVRETKGKKNTTLPWARDLQMPRLDIHINLGKNGSSVNAQYAFPWPLQEHENKLFRVFDFWLAYHRNPNTDQLLNA